LENCKYAIDRLGTAKEIIERGSGIRLDTAKETSTQPATYRSVLTSEITKDDATVTTGDKNHEFKDKIINDVYSVIHGILIQEWEHFLYDIFTEGVVYYIKGYDLADIRHKFALENFNPTLAIEEIRKKISVELERALLKYETLFKESRSLFKIDDSDLLNEIKTQVQVRHIFQHNQGKIRRMDLDSIGSNGSDACFNILDDEGKLRPYKEDEEIWLSLPEIQKLYKTIEQYSEKFQIRAEKAMLREIDSTE
jgi:hypothetical protein